MPTTKPSKRADADSSEPQATGRDTSLNLYQRILAVMDDVRGLQKDKTVGGGGNFSYKAMSEYKVVSTMRTAMLRHGLVLFPIGQVHKMADLHRENNKIVSLSTVDVQYKLVNVDKPEEFEVLASSGTGVDSQDKGVGKAMTYSMKYALMRAFLIPTGDDPDDVHNEDLEREQAKRAEPAKPEGQPQPVMRAESNSDAQAGYTGSGPSTPEGDPLAASQPSVKYATPAQKEEIIRLLNNVLVTRQEKTKMLLAIGRLDEERATEAIAKLNRAIEDRGGSAEYVDGQSA